jgi:hypothetical protein
MITHYKLGKIFGPSMVFAGYILIVFGVLTIYFTFTSTGLALLGAIIAFTTSGTVIDTEKRQYKSYVRIAGIIRVGKELPFNTEDKTEVKKFKGKHATYSWSNRQSTTEVNDYRIYLIKADSKKKTLLARFEEEEEALEESRNLNAIINM